MQPVAIPENRNWEKSITVWNSPPPSVPHSPPAQTTRRGIAGPGLVLTALLGQGGRLDELVVLDDRHAHAARVLADLIIGRVIERAVDSRQFLDAGERRANPFAAAVGIALRPIAQDAVIPAEGFEKNRAASDDGRELL